MNFEKLLILMAAMMLTSPAVADDATDTDTTAADRGDEETLSVETDKPGADATDFRVYWKNGLRFDSNDGNFKLAIGGRIQADWAFFADDNLTGLQSESGIEFRRMRFYLGGTIYKNIEYKFQYDLVSSDPVKDTYIKVKDIPGLGYLKFGHFQEQFGLDGPTSSKYITFLERALPETFGPGRNIGIATAQSFAEDRVILDVGLFKEGKGIGIGNRNYATTTRLSLLPWSDDGDLLHIGGSFRYRNVDGPVDYAFRPEAHLAQKYVTTGDIETDNQYMAGAELAFVYDSLHVSGEFVNVSNAAPVGFTDTTLHGWYAQVGYFLTGEKRPFKKTVFSRVKPKDNVGDGGIGAWEVAVRISQVDVADGQSTGTGLLDFTAAVNWYLNPNTRLMTNYILADVDGLDQAHIVQSRIQVDF